MSVNKSLSPFLNDQFVVLNASQSVGDAYSALKAAGGNNWWLLIIKHKKEYEIQRFFDLNILALRLGPDFFKISIQDLPRKGTILNTIEIGEMDQIQAIELAGRSPSQFLGITREGLVIGILIASRTRNDVFAGPSAIELYGILADLSADARVRYEAKAPPPVCPHCAKKGYQTYDLQRQLFICPHCKQTVK